MKKYLLSVAEIVYDNAIGIHTMQVIRQKEAVICSYDPEKVLGYFHDFPKFPDQLMAQAPGDPIILRTEPGCGFVFTWNHIDDIS